MIWGEKAQDHREWVESLLRSEETKDEEIVNNKMKL